VLAMGTRACARVRARAFTRKGGSRQWTLTRCRTGRMSSPPSSPGMHEAPSCCPAHRNGPIRPLQPCRRRNNPSKIYVVCFWPVRAGIVMTASRWIVLNGNIATSYCNYQRSTNGQGTQQGRWYQGGEEGLCSQPHVQPARARVGGQEAGYAQGNRGKALWSIERRPWGDV